MDPVDTVQWVVAFIQFGLIGLLFWMVNKTEDKIDEHRHRKETPGDDDPAE